MLDQNVLLENTKKINKSTKNIPRLGIFNNDLYAFHAST